MPSLCKVVPRVELRLYHESIIYSLLGLHTQKKSESVPNRSDSVPYFCMTNRCYVQIVKNAYYEKNIDKMKMFVSTDLFNWLSGVVYIYSMHATDARYASSLHSDTRKSARTPCEKWEITGQIGKHSIQFPGREIRRGPYVVPLIPLAPIFRQIL